MNTEQLIKHYPGIPDDVRELLLKAVSTRGKYKGYLLTNPPKVGAGAWYSLVWILAPSRVSYGKLFGLEHELVTLDPTFNAALNIVEPPFRWNVWNPEWDRELKRVKKLCKLEDK